MIEVILLYYLFVEATFPTGIPFSFNQVIDRKTVTSSTVNNSNPQQVGFYFPNGVQPFHFKGILSNLLYVNWLFSREYTSLLCL